MRQSTQRSPRARDLALIFRVLAHFALAIIIVSVPAVGEHRFWLAALIVGVGSPIAVLLNRLLDDMTGNWADALLDLVMVVTLAHLVPHLWMAALCLGLMVALAPSLSLHPKSHWIYLTFGVVMLTGMTLVVVVHDQQGWALPLAAVAVTYPSMLYYTYTQMQHANAMRRSADTMRGMSELAGSVAHDFNNMLTCVGGHAELALMELPPGHPARQDLLQVLEGTERASLLCNQLLSFAGRRVGNSGLVDLSAETQTMAGLIRPAMPAGVTIRLDIPEQSLFVGADVSQVHQVLMNVLLNAGDAMRGTTGTIVVKLEQKSVDADATPRVVLTVADSGSGIPDSVLGRLFEPFFTTKATGRGIGLATTKRVMETLDGAIVLRNLPDGGTEVQLTFKGTVPIPTTGNEQPAQSNANSPPTNEETETLSRGRVLVVDDNHEVLTVTHNMLRQLHFDVVAADSADEAIEIFEHEHTRLDGVLLDLKMPGKDGWSCLQELRAIAATKPVIICSGYDPADSLPLIARHDAHLTFLGKPFRAEQLAGALQLTQPA